MRLPTPPNLITTDHALPSRLPRLRDRPIIRRAFRLLRAIAITVIVVFVVLAWTTRTSNPNVLESLRASGAVRSVLSLIRNANATLIGESEDRITVLLLGMGGAGHEGPLLTDTMILANAQLSTRRVTLISIPRDLGIPLADGRLEKANAINAYAEVAAPGSGGAAIRSALERILDTPIPYHIRVDFVGFAGLVDELGGVDVTVERTLDDLEYPILGKESAPWRERFEHLVIPAGRTRMDGALALKYVRSRHGRNGEGSDFARGKRQQQVLLALRDRITDRDVLTNPRRILALLDAWRTHVETNLSPPELYRLAALARRMANGAAVEHVTFSDAPGGDLAARTVGGAFVLQPRDGTFDRIRARVAAAFTGAPPPAPPSPLTAAIWNGTNVSGLAARTAALLTAEGIEVTDVRNAPTRTVTRTIIYYTRGLGVGGWGSGVIQATAERLATQLRAETSTAFPSMGTNAPLPNILIVLGASSAQ